jgi:hypothetical protein
LLATEQRPGITSDPAADKLRSLLDYVEQVVRLDERPAFRLAEHRLSTGQTLALHQHELHALPGIRHDLTDEDGPIWLAVERLQRGEPPACPESLKEWLDVAPDPEVAPRLREERIVTVPAREKDDLLATGQARPEDCAAALDPNAVGQFDMRLRLEDRPELRNAAETYMAEQWLPWAEAERPRRRSMAVYQRLFEIAQLADLVADQPFELVWGLGLTRWKQDAVEIDLPIVERLVEIEIAEEAGGDIRVRPRTAPALANLRLYEELRVEGVTLAADAAQRAIAAAGQDGISPFLKESFEPALRACQSRLDAEGRYLPDHAALEPTASLPPPDEHLVVSDRWVLFARRRSDNFLLADLANLKKSVEDKALGNDLPGPARTLVLGPKDRPDGPWRPLAAGLGQTDHAAEDTAAPEADPDLFFPKPFNDEQIEIVRRLEKTDGIVVQGPPGTGKTHTIANIVCHYLATGRRVLVVSHAEPALAVLRAQLPESVRDLAISITATEREGFKQLSKRRCGCCSPSSRQSDRASRPASSRTSRPRFSGCASGSPSSTPKSRAWRPRSSDKHRVSTRRRASLRSLSRGHANASSGSPTGRPIRPPARPLTNRSRHCAQRALHSGHGSSTSVPSFRPCTTCPTALRSASCTTTSSAPRNSATLPGRTGN